jgi:hypothetical protein
MGEGLRRKVRPFFFLGSRLWANAQPMTVSRNRVCPCGSGQKFKHCCGALSKEAVRPTDADLETLAVEADDEGLRLGEEPKQRSFQNVLRILNSLGIDGVSLIGDRSPEIVKRVHAANNRLFRPIDKREGGIHLGFFMFRDLFSRLYVPVVLGNPTVDFVRLLDLSDDQKRWMATDGDAMARFEDQAIDLFDFAYGCMEFGHTRFVTEQAKELIYRAHIQLEAAAATATSAYDYRGTLQGALLGAELALKAGLACNGYTAEMLRQKIGHDTVKAVKALEECEPNFDAERVNRSVQDFPNFAQSRYGGPQPDRREMGHILMKAQYVASEVTRTFTDRNLRASQTAAPVRSYPA